MHLKHLKTLPVKKTFPICPEKNGLLQVAQRGGRVLLCGDIQNTSGRGSGQPALGPYLRRGWDQMTSIGPSNLGHSVFL